MQTLFYPIRLPSDVLESLGAFTGHFWSDTLALEPYICEAIHNYMHPAPAAEQQQATGSEAGYQWKQVFLPAGTRLRASFGGESYFAEVEGNEIRHGGQAMSPSRFANLRGSGNRNAWKAVWLRLPGSEEWLLADVCRSARRMAIARLLGGGTQAEHPQQERRRQPADRRVASRPAHVAPKREPAAQAAVAVPVARSQAGKRTGKGRRGKRRAARRPAENGR